MKLAALILLLANIAAFLWFRLSPPGTAVAESGLTLTARTTHPLKILDGPASGARCLLFNATTDATRARASAADLRREGYPAHAVTREQQQASGYWVLLTGFKDLAAAQSAAARLRRNGIRDLFVMQGSGDEGATLSLGLFRDFDHARKRASHVREFGFRPRIRERFRTTSHWTVQIPATASARAAFSASTEEGGCRVSSGGGG